MLLFKGAEGRGVAETLPITDFSLGNDTVCHPQAGARGRDVRSKSEEVKIDSGMLAVFNFMLPCLSRMPKLSQTGAYGQAGKYN